MPLLTNQNKTPRLLVACEFSGIVRDAFAKLGWDAWSCDLKPSERPGNHFQGNVIEVLDEDWDMMIAHPMCDHLALSGAKWFRKKRALEVQQADIQFAMLLWRVPIPHICLENPMSILGRYIGKRTQEIQPWQFGHGEVKTTWLWLKGLPMLVPTNIVEGREARVHNERPSEQRKANRSRTYEGVAKAMAKQWTAFLNVFEWTKSTNNCTRIVD